MTNDVKNSLTVPNYLKLYEFFIYTTVASVSVTVIFWALAKKRHILPPPSPLLRFVDRINPYFCGNVPTEAAATVTENGLSKQEHVNLSDWAKVFIGLNNISLILLTIVYVLGIIVICA